MAIEHDIAEVGAAIANGSFNHSSARAWERVQEQARIGAKEPLALQKVNLDLVDKLGQQVFADLGCHSTQKGRAVAVLLNLFREVAGRGNERKA